MKVNKMEGEMERKVLRMAFDAPNPELVAVLLRVARGLGVELGAEAHDRAAPLLRLNIDVAVRDVAPDANQWRG